MQHRCPQCGHDLHDHDGAAHDSVGIVSFEENEAPQDIGTGSPQKSAPQPTPSKDQRTGGRGRILLALAVVVAALAVLAAVLFAGDEPLAAEPEPTFDELADQQDGNGLQPDDSVIDNSGTANFPPSDEHRGGDTIADLFSLRINGASNYAVVYPTVMGLQMLSAAGATSPELEVAVGFEEAVRLPLLNDGSRTWAVNPADLTTAFVVSTQFVVVDIDVEGSVAFINPSVTPTNVGVSSFGAWGPGFNVPADSDILAIPGRGLLIVPATGGTFRLDIGGVAKISEDRVIAAGKQSEVYQRCDDDLTCDVYVTGVGNTAGVSLEIDASAPIYVSPDGGFVLAADLDGFAQITNLGSSDEWDVVEGSISSVGWSPDGTFVAFVAGDELLLAFPDEQRVESLTIPTIPSSRNLLVVEAPG